MQQTVLLVDDNTFYCSLVTFLLVNYTTYAIRSAKNGQHALQLARQSPPHLFLLDYQLPDMTGLQLYDQLHQLPGCEHVPALLITANLPNSTLEAQLARRNLAGMSKPFTRKAFLQALDTLVISPHRC